jgi:elongation factor 1-gamma
MIWAEAAPKIAAGILTGIFIECSYTNAQGDAVLYGHLSPRHLLAELQSLAEMVKEARREHEKEKEEARKGRKRKRASYGLLGVADGTASDGARKSSRTRSLHVAKGVDAADDEIMTDYARSPTPAPSISAATGPTTHLTTHAHIAPGQIQSSATLAALNLSSVSAEHSRALMSAANDAPLKGLKVVVIHVKDTLADGPLIGDDILRELTEGEKALAEQGKALGCVFEISQSGNSYYF